MGTAVVVGAGVGGLAAAGALARSGWQVTLIERNDRLRGSGVALLVWPNGVAALRALDLDLSDIAFPVPAGGIRRPDGRWLVHAGAPGAPGAIATARPSDAAVGGAAAGAGGAVGAGTGTVAGEPVVGEPGSAAVVVHADDLHDALMAGLSGQVEIRTATSVTAVRANASEPAAVSTGKHTFEADLVVAADGAHSIIRRRLAPRAVVVSAGYTTWRAVIPWFRAPKLPETAPASGEMLGAGQRFVYATLGERGASASSTRGGIYWSATAPGAPRPESAQTQLGLLRRWFADWHLPVGELLAATEPEDLRQQAGEELRPLPVRFAAGAGRGGFVLLGDAAHVTTPALAQGACLALEDAATLRAVVGGAPPGEQLRLALDRYTAARHGRVARVARMSRRLGLLLQTQGRLSVRARDAALGRLSPQLLERAAASVQVWTPPSPFRRS